MLSTLSEFDAITAAGLLARTATAIEDDANPAARTLLPNELGLREAVVRELRDTLGLDPEDCSDNAVKKLVDALDIESDRLLGPWDERATLAKLSEKGELPSDLYEVILVPQIENFHGRKFARERLLIIDAVKHADREQHYEPSGRDGQPVLLSLFAKYFADEMFPLRSFTMLVVGQRDGMKLFAHQAWRIYPDVVDVAGASTLIDLLQRFSDKFGAEIEMGGQKGKFILKADIEPSEGVKTSFNIIAMQNAKGRVRAKRTITVTCFIQRGSPGSTSLAALAVGIDLDQYRESLLRRGW
jgi:hypothetical protein